MPCFRTAAGWIPVKNLSVVVAIANSGATILARCDSSTAPDECRARRCWATDPTPTRRAGPRGPVPGCGLPFVIDPHRRRPVHREHGDSRRAPPPGAGGGGRRGGRVVRGACDARVIGREVDRLEAADCRRKAMTIRSAAASRATFGQDSPDTQGHSVVSDPARTPTSTAVHGSQRPPAYPVLVRSTTWRTTC